MTRRKKIFSIVLTGATMLMQIAASAQAANTDPVIADRPVVSEYFFNPMFYLAVFMALMIALVIYALVLSVHSLTQQLAPNKKVLVAEEAVTEKAKRRSLWNILMDKLTRTVPMAQEKDILLDHNYDGIKELDNQLPPWWKWGFYLTIVFAVFYMLYYHISGSGKLMAAEYKEEMNKAAMEKELRMKESKNLVTEENVAVLTSSEELAAGKNIYAANCVTCHGALAEGTPTAPNLTDAYWIHGGGIRNMFRIITNGVSGKAMISWSQKLSPRQINEVSSYIFSLQGSNPAGAKEPEGELATPESVQGTAANADSALKDSKNVN